MFVCLSVSVYLGQVLMWRSKGQGQGHSSQQDQNKRAVAFDWRAFLFCFISVAFICYHVIFYLFSLPPTTKLRRYCFHPCLFVCLSVCVCLFVCLFVNNFLTTILVVEWWNFQGLIDTLRSGNDSFLKGLGQRSRSRSSKRSNSLNWL